MASIAKKVILQGDPFAGRWRRQRGISLFERGQWPASWVHPMSLPVEATVYAYRRTFCMSEAETIRLHVTADESYSLYLDDCLVGRGPERGCPERWFYDSYDLQLPSGTHVLTAIVTALGQVGPRFRMSFRTGWLCCTDQRRHRSLLATGASEWKVGRVEGLTFEKPFPHDCFSMGWNTQTAGAGRKGLWGDVRDEGVARTGLPGAVPGECNRFPDGPRLSHSKLHQLSKRLDRIRVEAVQNLTYESVPETVPVSATEPALVTCEWLGLLNGRCEVHIPPSTRVRVVLNLGQYFTAYSFVRVRNGIGSSIRVRWTESLFDEPVGDSKGQRDTVVGKYFRGVGDAFVSSGYSDDFATLFWRAGRYVEILVETKEEALHLVKIEFEETRYDLEIKSELDTDDARVKALMRLMRRTLEVSSHDGFIDPYYEQMMWVGDCYPTVLGLLASGADDSLVRRCLTLFDFSRNYEGWLMARWPARDRMMIPTYGLLWIGTLHVYFMWSGDVGFLRSCLTGVRSVLEAFLRKRNSEGLIELDSGWNFLDWVPQWEMGIPPGGDGGVNASQHWMLIWALRMASELEEYANEPQMARRWYLEAAMMAEVTHRFFWSEAHGLYADEPGGKSFSEHAQCLAVISDQVPDDVHERLRKNLPHACPKMTIGFGHVYFESCYRLGRIDWLWERLEQWFEFVDQGFLTLPEQPEPTRSDCHAWGIYPWHHFYASVLGIRPTYPGFEAICIEPRLHHLKTIRATLSHPRGKIRVDVCVQGESVTLSVNVPEGVRARIKFGEHDREILGGEAVLRIHPVESDEL